MDRMIHYFQNKFALSAVGARNMMGGIFWTTLYNLVIIAPFGYTFFFLTDYFDNGTIDHSIGWYLGAGIAIGLVMFAIDVLQYNSVYTSVFNEAGRSRLTLAETLRKLPLAYFKERDLSDLTATIMEDCSFNEKIFSHAVPQLYAGACSLLLIGIGLFVYNWRLALALLWVVPLALLLVLLSRLTMKRSLKRAFDAKRIESELIQEGIEQIQDIKAYNGEKQFLADFDEELKRYEKSLIDTELVCGLLLNLSYILLHLGLVTLLIAGALMVKQGTVPVFDYLVLLVMGGSIFLPIIEVCNNLAMLEALKVRIDRSKEIQQLPRQEGSTDFAPTHFDIEFKDVSFSYLSDRQVLKGVSFIARQGEVTALVGPSGGGKSTVAKLAARLWDASDGRITLGGTDLASIDPETLLKHYAIVFQDVLLFNMSIYDNIRLGREDATREEIMEAARIAQCDEFVRKLPQGYDTRVGENGARLSGGERQRISIARALLKDAPIILLDEATASLDVENETKIQTALSSLIKHKTVLLIAHRMRTIAKADRIVVIDNGKVVEMGRPADLMQRQGTFARMVKTQSAPV